MIKPRTIAIVERELHFYRSDFSFYFDIQKNGNNIDI